MTSKWVETGILRKKQTKENFDELLVFGYACKLFRDDERALHIDQGKHLIPWMGDERLKIDRYDGRGTLSDLSSCEASSEGYDATRWLGLNESERKLEQLCDEERYYFLHRHEEEEMASIEEEERLKRSNEFHYNYDVPASSEVNNKVPIVATCEEEIKVFVPDKALDVPVDIDIPKSVKENARIEKTALFVSQQGPQMEILIKAKQSNNPQFSFMNQNDPLQKYYRHLLNAIKSGQYKPKEMEEDEEDGSTLDTNAANASESEHYLHPALTMPASVLTVPTVLAVPPAPTIQYKPTADCAYSQLVSRIRGNVEKPPALPTEATPSQQELELGEQYYQYYQAQYYQYYQQIAQQYATQANCDINLILQNLHLKDQMQQQAAQCAQAACAHFTVSAPTEQVIEERSTQGTAPLYIRDVRSVEPKISLVHYSSDSDEQEHEEEKHSCEKSTYIMPPQDVAVIVDKMATYVSKNGLSFEQGVKEKGDPRFAFLHESHPYHKYYRCQVNQFSAKSSKKAESLANAADKPHVPVEICNKAKTPPKLKDKAKKKEATAAVCFSIKKSREESPKDMKSALPIEESDEENSTSTSTSTPPMPMTSLHASIESDKGTALTQSNASPTAEVQSTKSASNERTFTDDPIFEMIDLTGDTQADRRVAKKRVGKQLLSEAKKQDNLDKLQRERKKRAALFLKMQSERRLSHESITIRSSRRPDVSTTSSESDLEEGEIKSKSKRSKKHKKKSRKERSNLRKNRSVLYDSKSKHRKLEERKYSSPSSTSSDTD